VKRQTNVVIFLKCPLLYATVAGLLGQILEGCYTCTPHPLSSSLFIKQIDFNKKVVSDVTLETTFSLKSICLMKMGE
jgi:hypothetical protein